VTQGSGDSQGSGGFRTGGFRRVPRGSRLPWVPKGFPGFQGFLRIPEVPRFSSFPKIPNFKRSLEFPGYPTFV